MNLREYLAQTEKRVVRETFGSGDGAFEVELRLCSRSDLDAMRKKATTDVRDRVTKQWTKEVDPVRLRGYLRDHCVTGWAGLTYAKAVTLCNRTVPNGELAQYAGAPVEFSPDAVDMLLAEALGFEDWVWERVTTLAEETARDEVDAKNA